jgi:hypothetical protein
MSTRVKIEHEGNGYAKWFRIYKAAAIARGRAIDAGNLAAQDILAVTDSRISRAKLARDVGQIDAADELEAESLALLFEAAMQLDE